MILADTLNIYQFICGLCRWHGENIGHNCLMAFALWFSLPFTQCESRWWFQHDHNPQDTTCNKKPQFWSNCVAGTTEDLIIVLSVCEAMPLWDISGWQTSQNIEFHVKLHSISIWSHIYSWTIHISVIFTQFNAYLTKVCHPGHAQYSQILEKQN